MSDAGQVLNCLQRGAHRLALNIYRGAVLPRSEAPGIVELRDRVGALLREAILTDASAGCCCSTCSFPRQRTTSRPGCSALRLLPPRSPKRAAVVADLERLEAATGA